MAFYLKPPGGNISLQKLSQFAVTRLKFLLMVYQTQGDLVKMHDLVMESAIQSDCLIEGTAKDCVSHYILRLICCHDRELMTFFVAAETYLFDFRFSCMSYKELVRLLSQFDSYLFVSDSATTRSQTLLMLHETFSSIKTTFHKWTTIVKAYLSGEEKSFKIPFKRVLRLVALRKVVLQKGMAYIPVWRLREIATSLFSDILLVEMKQAQNCSWCHDERIDSLARQIKRLFNQTRRRLSLYDNLTYHLTHGDIDAVSHMFPPCMATLHQSLRTHHRLRHQERVQYTLFLKEIGLPVHEALMFWRKEYSMVSSNGHGCCHDWNKDGDRYTYSIRHLYGLEGSRTNYRGHACVTLQTQWPSPGSCGGCPFSQYDSLHLQQLLTSHGLQAYTSQILEPALKGHWGEACQAYQQAQLKKYKGTGQIDGHRIQRSTTETLCNNSKSRGTLSSPGQATNNEAEVPMMNIQSVRATDHDRSTLDPYTPINNPVDRLCPLHCATSGCADTNYVITCNCAADKNISHRTVGSPTQSNKQFKANCSDVPKAADTGVQSVFTKPIDYYTSYHQLIERLKYYDSCKGNLQGEENV